MHVSAASQRALEYIARRADDVMNAYTPGAMPSFSDVATETERVLPTFDPMSVTLPDGCYLVTAGPNERARYTRDGTLRFADGVLAGTNAQPILGFGERGSPLEKLVIDPVDLALKRVRNPRIEADGSVAYDRDVVDPITSKREVERVCIGHVALARFPAASKLTVVDATHSEAPSGVAPHVGLPGDGNFSLLGPMQRLGSRIDIDRSLEKLEDAYLAFDGVQAAHKAQGTLVTRTMDLLK